MDLDGIIIGKKQRYVMRHAAAPPAVWQKTPVIHAKNGKFFTEKVCYFLHKLLFCRSNFLPVFDGQGLFFINFFI